MPTLDRMRGELLYSSRIGAALLDVLAESGDFAGRSRALRALGNQGSALHSKGHWIAPKRLSAMIRAADIDDRMARRIGQTLVRPDGVGLALCYSGLATTEKAYRRTGHLFARESVDSQYEPKQIDGQRGEIWFHPAPEGSENRLPAATGKLLCSVRAGMLEAVPLLYGLVPARVRETQCAYDGAHHCAYEVSWTRQVRGGLFGGAAAGIAIAAGLVFSAFTLGWSPWIAGLAGFGVLVLSAAAGRSLDLARQLEAVAGARRGHLALLDQLDTSLAERMDDLAKAGGEQPVSARRGDIDVTGLVPVDRHSRGASSDERPAEAARSLREAVNEMRDAVAEQQQRALLEETASTGEELLALLNHHGQLVERAAEGLIGPSAPAPGEPSGRRAVDLRDVIKAAVDVLRPQWPTGLHLDLDLARGTPEVVCDVQQIEYVVDQLLRNASEASHEGAVRVALSEAPGGVEVAVEDEGEGLSPEVIERVFDPFDDSPAGMSGGMGLPICLRIVQEHGGELQIKSGDERGTRVSFVLPLGG